MGTTAEGNVFSNHPRKPLMPNSADGEVVEWSSCGRRILLFGIEDLDTNADTHILGPLLDHTIARMVVMTTPTGMHILGTMFR